MGTRIAGVVLAAGRSERMGTTKQLLEIDGLPMIRRVVDAAARSSLDEVVVVLGHDDARVRRALGVARADARAADPRLRVVHAEDFGEGISASLRAGIDAARASSADAVAVLLGDEPDVMPDHIDLVLGRYRAAAPGHRPEIVRTVYVHGGARRPGHPVVLDALVWPELRSLRGDQGARAVIAADPARVVEVEIASPPPRDLDTPADVAARARDSSGRAAGGQSSRR